MMWMKSGRVWVWAGLWVAVMAGRGWGDGAECDGWGEFRGIRVEGELVPFATSVKVLDGSGKVTAFSATQTVGNTQFSRAGDTQTSSATIGGGGGGGAGGGALGYRQVVRDVGRGEAEVTITVTANRAIAGKGVYYYVTLPADVYSGGTATLMEPAGQYPAGGETVTLGPRPAGERYGLPLLSSKGIRVAGAGRSMELTSEISAEFGVLRDTFIDTDYKMQPELRLAVDPKTLDRIAVFFPLVRGDMAQGQQATATFTIKTTATVDRAPVTLALDRGHPGPGFDGIGGNFRIQSAQDQAHLTYNLENLRVAWGRVEMPLAQWQPQENVDPVAAGAASAPAGPARGGLGRGGRGGVGGPANTQVQQAMAMARTLAEKKIPFVISAWSAPQWAYGPAERKADQPAGIQALRLNPEKTQALYTAIGSYLKYLKANYGAEPVAFSWNEPDLGINVLFTPEEHAAWIKGLGQYLASEGLKTRMLLADACSPHPVKYVAAAMADPECRKYIAAVSFHSWHDGTAEEFAAWGKAAQTLKVPLLCGEGGTDSDAYRYTQIFAEPWFALYECDTYLQMMEYGQLTSVLHWQLTENYGVLASSGRGAGAVLTPTRRFFYLKQLDLTPAGAPFVPLTGASPEITHAAYGNAQKGYAIHLLNNGAAREVTITGVPNNVKSFHVYVTDGTRGMKEKEKVAVTPGTLKQDPPPPGSVKVMVDAEALTTVLALPGEMGPEDRE